MRRKLTTGRVSVGGYVRVNLRGQKKRDVGIQILLTNREEKKSSRKRKVGSVCARCESESEIGRYVEG
jgi:hypothetical protein